MNVENKITEFKAKSKQTVVSKILHRLDRIRGDRVIVVALSSETDHPSVWEFKNDEIIGDDTQKEISLMITLEELYDCGGVVSGTSLSNGMAYTIAALYHSIEQKFVNINYNDIKGNSIESHLKKWIKRSVPNIKSRITRSNLIFGWFF